MMILFYLKFFVFVCLKSFFLGIGFKIFCLRCLKMLCECEWKILNEKKGIDFKKYCVEKVLFNLLWS